MKRPKFKVGDRVVGNAGANVYGITRPGWKGVVVVIVSSREIGVLSDGKSPYYVDPAFFDLEARFNPTLPVCQRCGKPVKVVKIGKQFIRAEVHFPSGSRVLTFNNRGHFYSNVESDFDLVNA